MKKIIAAVLVPVVVLLLMESCARVIVTAREDLRSPATRAVLPETVPSRELGWERLPDFHGRLGFDFGGPVRAYDARGFQTYDTAQVADKSTPRIVAIGDSNTYGWGVPPESAFPEVLDRALVNASVINLGMLGYTSFQGYRTLLKYGGELQPAAIIASFNYNDRRYVLNQEVDSEAKFAKYADGMLRASTYALLNKIYIGRLMRSVMRKAGLIEPEPVFAMDVRSLEARVPPDSYRENLRKIAEYGRANRIPVVFLLLKDNPTYTAQLRSGIGHDQNGQHERAVRAFNIGLSNRITGTLSRKHLVRVLEQQGAKEQASAMAHVEGFQAMDGAEPIYLDAAYHEVMIQVAREFGIALVDARAELDAHPEWFIDMCHPDETGHARIADLLQETIKEVAPALANEPVTGQRPED